MKRLAVVGILVTALMPETAGAQTVEEQAALAAASYLEAAQNSDGSWGATPDIHGLVASEVVIALRAHGSRTGAYYRGVSWLENRALSSADHRARRIAALGAEAADLSADVLFLDESFSTVRAVGDGWGLSGVYGPSALDTALALIALGELGVPPGSLSSVNDAVALLIALQPQGGDSGWPAAIGLPAAGDPIATSLVLRSYAAVRGPVTGHETSGDDAAAFLAATVSPASATSLQQAHAALATLRWTPGTSAADAWFTELLASQTVAPLSVAGSWNDDPYTTAIALQAFAAKLGTDDPALQQAVHIPDLELRTAFNLALAKNRADSLRKGELASLTELDASDLGIEDLTGIEEAENLERIYLQGNQITDLSPLESLANLTYAQVTISCDVNVDGAIGPPDPLVMLNALEGGTPLKIWQLTAADVAPPSQPDGTLSLGDLVVVTRAAGGEIVPVCGN